MVIRQDCIKAISPYIDQPLVKILPGVRRCGKSTIFEMLAQELQKRGRARGPHYPETVYRDGHTRSDVSAKDMYQELLARIEGKGRCYLLLDEIQEITGWERCVNSLLEGQDVDIYVTGSNSKLMSSEISTYLTGRFVSIPVFHPFLSGISGFQKRRCPLGAGAVGGVYPAWRISHSCPGQVRTGQCLPNRQWHLPHRDFQGYCEASSNQPAGPVRPGGEIYHGEHGEDLFGQLHFQILEERAPHGVRRVHLQLLCAGWSRPL